MIFDKANSSKKQGGIGETRAIYEYTKLGYAVLIPVTDNNKYDLIVEKNGKFKRIQVKTTSLKEKSGSYRAIIEARGGGRNLTTRKRQDGDYDELFILTENDRCWMIPVKELDSRQTVSVGKKYSNFEI